MDNSLNTLKQSDGTMPDSSVLLSGRCRQCKGWGAQGMHLQKETAGDYRYCGIALFGDYEKVDTVPMFRLNITYGSGKGVVQTHGDFACPNFNPEFEGR